MGSVGVPFPITAGLDAVSGLPAVFRDYAKALESLLSIANWRTDELAELRYRASIGQGFQEAFAAMSRRRASDGSTLWRARSRHIRALKHETMIIHRRDDKDIPLAEFVDPARLDRPVATVMFSRAAAIGLQIEHAQRFARLLLDFFGEARPERAARKTLRRRITLGPWPWPRNLARVEYALYAPINRASLQRSSSALTGSVQHFDAAGVDFSDTLFRGVAGENQSREASAGAALDFLRRSRRRHADPQPLVVTIAPQPPISWPRDGSPLRRCSPSAFDSPLPQHASRLWRRLNCLRRSARNRRDRPSRRTRRRRSARRRRPAAATARTAIRARPSSDFDMRAEQRGKSGDDRETEAKAALKVAARIVHLVEFFENVFALFFGNADAGVDDVDPDPLAAPAQSDQNAALGR